MIDPKQFVWILHALGIIFIVWILTKLFHLDIPKFFRLVVQESIDLSRRKISVGTFNMIGFLGLLVFGSFIIICLKFNHVFDLVSSFISGRKAHELQGDAGLLGMFYFLCIFLVFSVAVTAWHDVRKRRK